MRKGGRKRNITGLNQSLQGMVTGLLRMGLGRYGVELQRSKQESLSDIYYRIHFCYVPMSDTHQLQAKLQCKWMQTRRSHILVGWQGVSENGLTKPKSV